MLTELTRDQQEKQLPGAEGDTACFQTTHHVAMGHSGDGANGAKEWNRMLMQQSFPAGIVYAFAYGSAAFSQSGGRPADGAKNDEQMLDLVFVVTDSYAWHLQNLQDNPSHYSFLGSAGAASILMIQRFIKAHIYFNVVMDLSGFVTTCGSSPSFPQVLQRNVRSMKYGVIQYEDLIRDLTHWDCLYVAGRLHKPVRVMIDASSDCSELSQALQANLMSALAVSILLLPESFTEDQLFLTIAGLSYFGDFRMIVGEDRGKVNKIVMPQKHHFQQLYIAMLTYKFLQHELYEYNRLSGSFSIPTTASLLLLLISRLPRHVMQRLGDWERLCLPLFDAQGKAAVSLGKEQESSIKRMRRDLSSELKQIITSIVWRSSLCQGVKGLFTTGFLKSAKYVLRKLNKMYMSIGCKMVIETGNKCNNNQ